jgi:hypothetical protein
MSLAVFVKMVGDIYRYRNRYITMMGIIIIITNDETLTIMAAVTNETIIMIMESTMDRRIKQNQRYCIQD